MIDVRIFRVFLSPLSTGNPAGNWVRQQAGPVVIVHKRDLERLQQAGVPNVVRLEYGGPQPGEVWVQVQV